MRYVGLSYGIYMFRCFQVVHRVSDISDRVFVSKFVEYKTQSSILLIRFPFFGSGLNLGLE